MVKKKFIDKKKSITYNLVYRSTEDERETDSQDAPPLESIEHNEANKPQRQRRYSSGHPLAWIEEEELQGELSETRRQELRDLGFPDDGYDYIRHMRTLGHGKAGIEGIQSGTNIQPSTTSSDIEETATKTDITDMGSVGPSVFLPATVVQAPTADVALFDATALTIQQQKDYDDNAAAGAAIGITAFSRQQDIDSTHGVAKRELEELDEMMRQIEEEDIDEGGDLLDDFVLTATQNDNDDGEDGKEESDEYYEEEGSEDDTDYEYQDIANDQFSHEYAHKEGKAPPRPGSIASTYWRDDRADRRNLLTVIDERFEHLALEYDDDDIGDIENDAEEGKIGGSSDVSQFQNVLDEFIQQHPSLSRPYGADDDTAADGDAEDQCSDLDSQGADGEATRPSQNRSKYTSKGTIFLQEEMDAYGFDNSDAAVAARLAKEAIRRAEEQGDDDGINEHRYYEIEDVSARERWDCESVLSLRSTLYNHPGTISEAPRRPPTAKIRLNKAGIPMGALSSHRQGGAVGGDDGGAIEIIEERARVVVRAERKKGETSEEKKARKLVVKQAKRDARVAKKELKVMYKEESVKAQRRSATAQVHPSVVL